MTMADSGLDAWEYGVQKHLASLPVAARQAFMAPASVDECMEKIRLVRYRQRNGYFQLMETLRPIIEPLKRFEGVIDVLSQTNSGMLSPIWGPIKAVVTLASDRLITLQTLSRLLERLVEPLKRFQGYEELFQDNLPLRRAMGALYCDLIDFCGRAVRFYGKKSVRTIFGSFDKDFREISDNIRHHWTEIDIAANFVNITESKAVRDAEEARRRVQARGDIQRWLCPARVIDDLQRSYAEHMPGSCDWFLHSEEYRNLLAVGGSNALRIIGRPGEGKTILASCIITELTEKTATEVLYFFCKAGDVEKRLPIHVIRSLMSQIWRLDDDLYPLMERWYQDSGRPNADSYTELCAMFYQILIKMRPGPLVIVIDALDELQNPKDLIDILQKCQIEASRSVKTVFTSRDHPDLRQLFSFYHLQTNIPAQVTKQSIFIYVKDRVSEMRFLAGTGLQAQLIPAIAGASDGLWLYARLILDEIDQVSSPGELQRLMVCLPRDLRELYTSILASVQGRFSDLQIRIAQQIFIWLDGADYMPWWHFHSNDIMEENVLSLLIRFANNGEAVFDPMSLIQKLCFPLVNVFETGMDTSGYLYAASFIHFSAEQYLEWTAKAPLRLLPTVMKPRRLRRLHRGVTSAWYFSCSDEFREVLEQLREDPYGNGVGAYFEMAYGMGDSWHMTSLPDGLEPEEVEQLDELCRPLIQYISTDDCLGWVEAAILINYAGGFMNLVQNVEKAVKVLSDKPAGDDPLPWRQYVLARKVFFLDFTYVLRTTGPGYRFLEQPPPCPEGFESRAVAMAILALGKQYQHYVDQATTLTDLAGGKMENKDRSRDLAPREWMRRRSSSVSPTSLGMM